MREPWETGVEYRRLVSGGVVILAFAGLIILLSGSIKINVSGLKTGPTPVAQDYVYKKPPVFSGRYYKGKNWSRDPTWRKLDQFQMVAAMAMLEVSKDGDGAIECFECSVNIVHSIINRAHKEGQTLPQQVSRKIYQPVIEPAQYAALKKYVGTRQHKKLSQIAYDRATGKTSDQVSGATHYLVHPRIMVALHRKQPCKYWSWGPFKCNGRAGVNWTGYNIATKKYRNQVMQDDDHTFLAPEGRHSAPALF